MKNKRTGAGPGKGRRGSFLWAAAFWLILWQIAAMCVNQELLLASPAAVLLRLCSLFSEPDFWKAVLFSFSRVICGFLLACLSGVAMSALSARFSLARELTAPLMGAVKATPVASFIILVLIWLPSRQLSIFISFLMALPVIYSNTLEGIGQTDGRLLEMADVFQVSPARRLRFLYLPQVMPYFRSACGSALGLCWKAGVAAEVIGLPQGSIGERLYQAKIYLETPELLAWTLTIILVSMGFQRLFLFLLDRLTVWIQQD